MFNNDTIMNEAPHMSAGGLRISTEALSKKSISAEKQIDMLQKHIQSQNERFATLRRQFTLTQNTLQRQAAINQEQAHEIASLKVELHKLRSTRVAETPSNPFMDLSKDEIIKKLDIAEQKKEFFKEKLEEGEGVFNGMSRILEYVAINAISILSPGIISPGSLNEILGDNPGGFLRGLFNARLFGQCSSPNCIDFIKTGESSKNPFLSFLHKTIQYKRVFEKLREDVLNGNLDEQKASERLMTIICKYGLDKLNTSLIKPKKFYDPIFTNEYEFDHYESKRLQASQTGSEKGYGNSFGLWPFNEFAPIVVDPEGFPGHYLTSLFINHFSDLRDLVKRVKIDSRESVELEIRQLKEVLKLKEGS